MSTFLERWSPSLLGIAIASAYMCWCPGYRAPTASKELLGAAISIGAIAVGFLANMKAVLFTIEKKRIIQQLKNTDHYNNLVDYLLWAIVASMFLSLVSAAGLIVDLQTHPRVYPASVALWLFAVVTALASYWRVVSLFSRILKSD